MSLVNYLGTYETLDQVWEAYPEGGKEGDYLYIASVLKKWNKYTSAWADPTEEDVEGSTIVSLEEDVVVGSSTLINYLGRFETLGDALNAYPEGGNEGDYIYVGDDIYAWDKYANEWVVSSDAPLEVAISEEDIIPNSNTFINYLGGFVDRDAVWQKYPEGGKVGDYLYIASDLHIWDKYICNWVAATPPDESSQIRPIEVLTQEGVVEYSENYINYLGVFESIEQAWEAYPEGGKEGDYIIVGGEQLRWNKYTSNWGEYDPDASTPARPVATIYGDLHVHNDVIIGEDLYARILETFTTKKWVLEQGYISMDDVTSELVMSKIVPDNTTIEVRDGKLVVIGGGGGGTADSVEWDNITGKPNWIGDTKPTYTLDEIVGSNGDGFVTLLSDQTIEGVKNFANGAKFNGALLSYDEEKKAWVFPGNIIASGGITAFGSLSTPVASLFEALPIDGTTIKRNPVTNELYVDTNVVGGSGTSGGGVADSVSWSNITGKPYWIGAEKPSYKYSEIDETPDLSIYATQSWVTGKGYITASALEPYALKTAIPTKLSQLTDDVVSGKYLSLAGGTISQSGYWSTKFKSTGQTSSGIAFEVANGNVGYLMYGDGSKWQVTAQNWSATHTLLHSGNYSDYALPKDGTAVAAWKLANAHYLWGQLFDGTSNIGGQMSFNAGNFILAHNATDAWTDGNGLTHPWYGIDFRAGGSYKGYISHWGGISLVSGNDITLATDKNVVVSKGKLRINQSAFDNGLILNRTAANSGVGIVAMSNDVRLGTFGINGTKTFEISGDNGIACQVGCNTGNLIATGGITAQNSSDRRLKKNIRKFNACKVLMSLGGVYEYEYVESEVQKNHIYEGTHYGLIYQHVKGTKLDVMCHEREDGFGTLNYIHPKFISLIAGATMESISEVEKMKRKIRTLEAKVKQLEQRA